MTFQQFSNIYDAQKVAEREHLLLCITVEKGRFLPDFQNIANRTYSVGSDSKYFDDNAGGNGLFGSCINNFLRRIDNLGTRDWSEIYDDHFNDGIDRLEHLSFEHAWVQPHAFDWWTKSSANFFAIDTPTSADTLILYLREQKFELTHVTYNEECPTALYIAMLETVLDTDNTLGITFTKEAVTELKDAFNHVYTHDEMTDILYKLTGKN